MYQPAPTLSAEGFGTLKSQFAVLLWRYPKNLRYRDTSADSGTPGRQRLILQHFQPGGQDVRRCCGSDVPQLCAGTAQPVGGIWYTVGLPPDPGGSVGSEMSYPARTMSIMDVGEHWQAWLERYGGDYATDEERRSAYRDFKANLAEIRAVFSQPEDMHVAGCRAAAERVAAGDADSPHDAELWVPADLTGAVRADWLEGFRSHFEPPPRGR